MIQVREVAGYRLNVKEHFGAKGDGVTNDTAAIQEAVDWVDANGSTTIFFPSGEYLIDGDFRQDAAIVDGYGIGQILLPTRNLSTEAPLSISFEGPCPPSPNTNWTNETPPLYTGGAVLKSSKVGAQGYYGMFAGGPPVGAPWSFSGILARFQNLTFRTYDNPKITPLSLGNIGQVVVEDCLFDTGTVLANVSEPTNASLGVVMPALSNWAVSRLANCDVIGYGYGYQWNEHIVVDDARAWLCKVGFQSTGGPHAACVRRLLAVGCPTALRFYGQPTKLLGPLQLDVEHTTGFLTGGRAWTNNSGSPVDIDDPNNLGIGDAYFCAVRSNVGTEADFTMEGGSKLTVKNIGSLSL